MRKLKVSKIYFLFILLSLTFIKFPTYSAQFFKKISNDQAINANTINEKNNTDYLLGPGDTLYIRFYGIPSFSKVYDIDINGYLDLPEIKRVYAKDKTLDELKNFLSKEYKEYILEPNLTLRINSYRPVNVLITGEVNRPGLYQLDYKNLESYTNNANRNSSLLSNDLNNFSGQLKINSFEAPKIFDALKLSKGISNNADLSNIKVIRKNSISNGGGKIITKLNFLSLLLEGNQDMNIQLRDGDAIIVSKGDKIIKEQILAIKQTNLNPEFLTVYISGNVGAPGEYQLVNGSSLIQAIYKAGGEKKFTGQITHMRFNENGNSEKNSFAMDFTAKVNSKKNPILLDGDIIHINKNVIGKTTTFVQDLSNPIVTGYTLFKIFE